MRVRSILSITVVLAAIAAPLLLMGEGNAPLLRYEVLRVKKKLRRVEPAPKLRLKKGDQVVAGDVLETGWFSSAEILQPEARARFRISSRSRVRLAGEVPGLLLEVEKGRLRAIFDKLEGREDVDRIIRTPTAVLAVRGTEYAVDVSSSGRTGIVVFRGVVDVGAIRGKRHFALSAGQGLWIRADGMFGEPVPHNMTQRQWDRGRMPPMSGERDDRMGGRNMTEGMRQSGSNENSGEMGSSGSMGGMDSSGSERHGG